MDIESKLAIIRKTSHPWRNYGRITRSINEKIKPKVTVDISDTNGISSLFLSLNDEGHVYSINLSSGNELLETHKQLISADNLTILESKNHIEIASGWDKKIDLLYVHINEPSYDFIKSVYDNWIEFLSEDGMMIFTQTMLDGNRMGNRKFYHHIELPKLNCDYHHGFCIVSKSEIVINNLKEELAKIVESKPLQKKSKICMITMFKNEAHSILPMLKSVTPYIDFWVIQDNGSTDGTPEIVKEWAEYYNIPGLLYKVEEGWKGFGWNRDHLLQKARSLDHGCQWIMKMDCDETLEVDFDFDWSLFDRLENQTYSVASVAPGIIYQRTWIWRADLPWRFHHDPAHETIYLDDGVTNEGYQMALLPRSFRMKAGEIKGESYATPTKYVTDSLILEEKLIREQSMLNDVYHFWYIAKSYQDAMRCKTLPLGEKHMKHFAERSIFYYTEWLNHTHQFEERGRVADRIDEMAYYSLVCIGDSYRILGDVHKAIDCFERAEGFCPRRNDHLIFLAESYWSLRKYKEMLKYTSIMMQPERTMPYPDFVFLISTNMYHDTGSYPQQLHQIALENINEVNQNTILSVNQVKKKRVFVVDNFYSDPDAVRKFAMSVPYQADNNWYKGQRSQQKFLTQEIKTAFEDIMGIKIREWETHGMNGSFQYCTPQDLLVYHYDAQTWAGMIYLTPDAPYDCGTSFFASKTTKARHKDDDPDDKSFVGGFYDSTKFDLVDSVGNIYNRLVLFDARCYHSASKYFGTNIQDSRLFHLFFFD